MCVCVCVQWGGGGGGGGGGRILVKRRKEQCFHHLMNCISTIISDNIYNRFHTHMCFPIRVKRERADFEFIILASFPVDN